MAKPRTITDDDLFRQLASEHPFYVVAKRMGVGQRAVSNHAKRLGLPSVGAIKLPTAAEIARVNDLTAAGWSVKRIADEIGRSQDFVARRRREAQGLADPRKRGRPTEGSRAGDPVSADTGDYRYEDMPESILAREWPQWRVPVNGAALAAAGRLACASMVGCSAQSCEAAA